MNKKSFSNGPDKAGWREQARGLKTETYALYFAYRDPRVRWFAKAFAALVVAYAVSPIDLIPDLIPVLGYLDDLVLVPAGIWLALRLIPPEVMQAARTQAAEHLAPGAPVNPIAPIAIVQLWAPLFAGKTHALPQRAYANRRDSQPIK